MKQQNFDLVVVGGGTSGIITAVAAARGGMKVAICEKNTFLGGLATGSGLAEMNACSFEGKHIYTGIVKEIFDKLVEMKAGTFNYQVPMSSNPNVKIDRFRYNPEILKLIFENMAVEAGVTIFYDCIFESAVESKEFTVIFSRGTQKYSLTSQFLVDATSNCEVVKSLDYPCSTIDKKNIHTSSTLFRLSNVNIEKVQNFIAENKLKEVIAKGFEQGILKGKILAMSPIPNTNDVSVNVTRANIDFTDIDEFSQGLTDTRFQILPIVDYIKKEVDGLEGSYISNIGPAFGIRDSSKVIGEYTFTLKDLEDMVKFEDSIAVGCYPMDIHDPVTKSVIWKVLPGVYYIPFRALLPKNSTKLLVVGKSISASPEAFAASRVMPIVFNVGESAGFLLAYAHNANKALNTLTPKEIHETLSKNGIELV